TFYNFPSHPGPNPAWAFWANFRNIRPFFQILLFDEIIGFKYQLIFETNYYVKQKYLEERPNIPEIGPKCPGRVGTWVGWEIVKSYFRQNPEVGLEQLMANQDAQAIFSQSKYKPIPR
ncbi:MAG: hypothetical protein O6939_00815, partial [Bacteroidetes bacterium]|nr:hypothetical protein [Bacteroidota bacterium]